MKIPLKIKKPNQLKTSYRPISITTHPRLLLLTTAVFFSILSQIQRLISGYGLEQAFILLKPASPPPPSIKGTVKTQSMKSCSR